MHQCDTLNGIPMLITTTRNLHFGMVDILPNITTRSIRQSIGKTLAIHSYAVFKVVTALKDGAFESVRGFLEVRM